MERIVISMWAIIGFICVGSTFAGKLTLIPNHAYAKIGESVDISCECDEDRLDFYMESQVVITHEKADRSEEELTSNSLLSATHPDKYGLAMLPKDVGKGKKFKLTIKNVAGSDGGKYHCLLKTRTGVAERKTIEFTILRDLSSINLKVGEQSISEVSPVEIDFLEGDYEVTCEAAGSNPAPVLEVYIGDSKKDLGIITTIKDSSHTYSAYKGAIKKVIHLAGKYNMKNIRCKASVPSSGFEAREAGFKLKIIPLTPTINCKNVSAMLNDRETRMSCTIAAKQEITCNNTLWENSNNGQMYYPGKRAADKNIVECKSLNRTTILSELVIYQVKKDAFQTTFQVSFQYHSGKHRHPVHLTQKPGSGAAGVTAVTSLIFLLAAIVTNINQW
ncbi:hypothetical protein ScPMuIL_015231 [Solemya velum]